MYQSTRNKECRVNTLEAVRQGLSKDGGLFVPEEIRRIKDIYSLCGLSYPELAKRIMASVLDDISEKDISDCVDRAYTGSFDCEEITPLVKVKDVYFLELFHGPTCAFKDLALTFLPHIMKLSAKDKPVAIITATSGDTGKAALEGFRDVEGTYIKVLYPHGMVSKIQERQMTTTLGKNTEVLAVEGNFDDCQRMVKRVMETFKSEEIYLSSANSINIARLIPQTVYYFKAYFDLYERKEIKKDEKVDFVVPTGNFGDILAGYLAKCMGLPVGRLVCASNENDVLTDFFNTGLYNAKRPLINTISPSIDILVSSNLERLLYLKSRNKDDVKEYLNELNTKGSYRIKDELHESLREDFTAVRSLKEETEEAIRKIWLEEGYLMDTHTAVAYSGSEKYESHNKKVILSTASPFKFSKAVYEAITGKTIEDDLNAMDILAEYTNKEIPAPLRRLKNMEVRHREVIGKNDEEKLMEKLRCIHEI